MPDESSNLKDSRCKRWFRVLKGLVEAVPWEQILRIVVMILDIVQRANGLG